MGTPFLSEIRIFSFNFAPKGWAMCNGQLLPINQNQALFSLLGTTYGGDGQTNFALPNLQGQVPIHVGGGFLLGQKGGELAHTLSIAELPVHSHLVNSFSSANPGDSIDPGNNFLAQATNSVYASSGSTQALAPAAVANAGGSQAHSNLQPFLTLTFIIALQ